MVVGKDFVWLHLPKTGGDATRVLFDCVPDLVVWGHHPRDPAKHESCEEAGVEGLARVANIRRLPSQVLSWVEHKYRFGTGRFPAGRRLSPEEVIEVGMPDQVMRRYFEGPERGAQTTTDRLATRWLRMESLREDFVAFISEKRSLSAEELERIQTKTTKAPMKYDHDPLTYFTPEQVDRLYAKNPLWAAAEMEAYGDPWEPEAVLATRGSN